ncbi:Y-family DNA polymerase [Novosphingobium pokkalii]|uniref:Y-family DNA polymerase n=1 Tax=Novosphingobium pokkalii TaxID=1770194 RepID=UPI00363C7CE5
MARSGQALRLAAVERDAARHGLAPGMTLADARARCPDLVTLPHDPAGDAALLNTLAGAMHALTPSVTPDPPDGLLLDISGCAHLFGSEARMASQAAEIAGLSTLHALAGNPAAARALVRHGTPAQRRAEDVAALPVVALDLGEQATTALRRAGLKRLGDLVTRPASALAARFGESVVLRLRQMTGDVAAPLAPAWPKRRSRRKHTLPNRSRGQMMCSTWPRISCARWPCRWSSGGWAGGALP